MTRFLVTAAACLLITSQAQATPHPTAPYADRHSVTQPSYYYQDQRRSYKKRAYVKRSYSKRAYKQKAYKQRPYKQKVAIRSDRKYSRTVQFLPHPEGCRRDRFCGCGTAKYLLDKVVNAGGLAIAANWIREFPKAACAPRMAAARRGHVFAIIECLDGNKVLAYDPNSGRRKTKIHVRSLAGYTVVDPHPKKVAEVKAIDPDP